MKTEKKKSRDESHFDDEFVKKPVKKIESKRDKKPRIYDLDDEEELPDFDTLLDDGLDIDNNEDDDY
jgi:hypothetical protein